MSALGNPPPADSRPEPEDVAAQRRQYTDDPSDYRARMTIAELVIASDLRHAIERQFREEGIVIP